MTAKRSEIVKYLPTVLGASEQEAAAWTGMSATMFRELVEEGVMPKPRQIRGRLIYDLDEVRAAFKSMPHKDEVAAAAEQKRWGAVRT